MAVKLGSGHYVGIVALFFVAAFFLLIPFYLGPDDLASCSETPDNQSLNDSCHQADAIVAISGGDTTARAKEAVKLYQNGWASQLIFSGAALDKSGPSNAQAMRKVALASGVSPSAILLEEDSANTQENAINTRTLIEEHSLRRIILVTSAYHQRRASLEFGKRSAGTALLIVNHPVANDKQWSQNWYLTPSGWWLTISELIKVIGFYATGK